MSPSAGSPIALLELARRQENLLVLERLQDDDVLFEYRLSSIWQERLGCDRFVRLRRAREGKQYAIERTPSAEPLRKRGTRRGSSAAPVSAEVPLIPYPEADPVGAKLGLEGAGIMAYQTGDQMHPPMVDDEELWRDAALWPEAAAEHTREAARALGLQPGDVVLDIGCGIGGPARLLVAEFGVSIFGVANSEAMLLTARRLNEARPGWADQIELVWHDCQDPYPRSGFDAAWSMNMIYRVPDKLAMLKNTAAALKPGGRLMLEDWMFTETATAGDIEQMHVNHEGGGGIARLDEMDSLLRDAGFVIEQDHDLGEVGRTHFPNHFVREFNETVRPRIERDFPSSPMSGRQMADEWVQSIQLTIDLYREDRMTYRRLVVATPR